MIEQDGLETAVFGPNGEVVWFAGTPDAARAAGLELVPYRYLKPRFGAYDDSDFGLITTDIVVKG